MQVHFRDLPELDIYRIPWVLQPPNVNIMLPGILLHSTPHLRTHRECVRFTPRLLRMTKSCRRPVTHQTTPPSIERVSTTAADGTPRGVAGTSQTIDVYGSPGPIASGGFRLWYGNDDGIGGSASGSSMSTSCISASSADLTAVAVADALSAMNDFFVVTVTETDPPFDDARRFVIDFSAPELGVGTLGVVAAAADCEWLQCNDGDCDESGVIVNREASVAVQEGAVEVRA